MNKIHKKRIYLISSVIVGLGVAIALVLYALQQNINLFYTPSQLLQSHVQLRQRVKLGGYVEDHSVTYSSDGQEVHFMVTDNVDHIPVDYHGQLPNLFREGQGVVVTGTLDDHGTFDASEVLAKHDAKYMPSVLKTQLSQVQKEANHGS